MKNLTNWDALFYRLNASCLKDERWSSKNFSMQRTKDVLAALKFLERHDMMQANIHSVAIAKLATMVAHSLGGKKVTVSAEDFLPFDMRKFRQENGMSEASGFVLKSLLKLRKLDPRLLAVLSDEIKTLSMREGE